jgi:hypothetical protein
LVRKLPSFEKEGAARAIKTGFKAGVHLPAQLLPGWRIVKNLNDPPSGRV